MSTSNINTFNPKYDVILGLPSGIQSFSTGFNQLGYVTKIETQATCKDLTNSFRITLVPRDDTNGATLYDMIEPMVYCEIRMKRESKDYTTIMRGFVTTISKSLDMSSGKPVRSIVISGENYGKAIKNAVIHYVYALDPSQVFAASGTTSPLFFGYGIDILQGNCTPSKIVTMVWNEVVTPTFQNILKTTTNRNQTQSNSSSANGSESNAIISSVNIAASFELDVDVDGVDGNRAAQGIGDDVASYSLRVVDPSIASTEMSVSDLFNEFTGKPFIEIFTDDAPDGTYLVFRPTPWRDRDREWVGTTSFSGTGPTYTPLGSRSIDACAKGLPIFIDQSEIVNYNLGRSDQEVWNYIMVNATNSGIGESFESQAMGQLTNLNPHFTVDTSSFTDTGVTLPQSTKLEYSRMELFGFRKLLITSKLLSVDPKTIGSLEDTNAFYRSDFGSNITTSDMFKVGQQLAMTLFNAFEHNSQLEQGSMVIRGREDIRAGMFVAFWDERLDTMVHVFYVEEVHQNFTPMESWLTMLTLTRGEAHLDRMQDDPRYADYGY